ncbi:VOC family protein [Ciceribacter thiooxidans]|uniref:VOC family protein n=1 Tax=Ciceribacter thiooxidans TaxID=1969821 RepID=A0ABV7I3Q6_9HYPH|nr:VOC family protein [Ciceribacter thiooxidans]
MALERRISIITLGVEDLQRSTAFYEKLGWRHSAASQEAITFMKLKGIVLALFSREALAADAGVAPGTGGFSGVTLAQNVESPAEVDRVIDFAVSCGASLVKSPREVFWGGYSGYFADPDGHLWEVAHNPFFPLDEEGHLVLPD